MRIAVGGIAVECCTFSPLLTRLDDFTLHRGSALLALYPFLGEYPDVTFVPLVRARALPGGMVEAETYARIRQEFLDGLREGPWDGVYLDLHGAMFVEGLTDAEGDWLAAVRQIVGERCLIAASYDLHGNVSQRVIAHLNILTAYRTAPHVDVDETRARAVQLLVTCLSEGIRPHLAFAPIPMLLPGEKAMTTQDPTRRLYATLPEVISRFDLLDASLLVGYVWADEARVGAAAVAVSREAASAQAAVQHLRREWWNARTDFAFGMPTGTIEACLAMAQAHLAHGTPVFISDAGDNITGGGVGDVTGVLAYLLAANVTHTVYAALCDAAAVEACHRAGVNSEVSLIVGGKLDPVHGDPLAVTGRVVALDASQPTNRQCVVAVRGIDVILTERRTAFTTPEAFTALGLDVRRYDMVVVKLGYLFPDLQPIAKASFLAFSPGAINPNVAALPYKHLTRPMFPLDENGFEDINS